MLQYGAAHQHCKVMKTTNLFNVNKDYFVSCLLEGFIFSFWFKVWGISLSLIMLNELLWGAWLFTFPVIKNLFLNPQKPITPEMMHLWYPFKKNGRSSFLQSEYSVVKPFKRLLLRSLPQRDCLLERLGQAFSGYLRRPSNIFRINLNAVHWRNGVTVVPFWSFCASGFVCGRDPHIFVRTKTVNPTPVCQTGDHRLS